MSIEQLSCFKLGAIKLIQLFPVSSSLLFGWPLSHMQCLVSLMANMGASTKPNFAKICAMSRT